MDDHRKTLLILSPGFSENQADTGSMPLQQIFVRSLKNNFPTLKIIVLSSPCSPSGTAHNWNDVEIMSLKANDKTMAGRIFTWFRVWKKLKQLNQDNNIIGLLSFQSAGYAWAGKYFAHRHSLKYYIWISEKDAEKNNTSIRRLRPEENHLIAMSDFAAKEFYKNHFIKPRYVIPVGFDTSLYAHRVLERDIDILGAGSLIGSKQYDAFVEVVNELTDEIPDVNARICGDGPEKKGLQSLISRLQLQENILVEGEKTHTEIFRLMQRSRIFLHTSSYPGCSMVCMEALYAGAMVISFHKPMAAWINHWYIVHDKKEMVEKILEILNDPATDYRPVLPYSANDSARAIMKLFGYT